MKLHKPLKASNRPTCPNFAHTKTSKNTFSLKANKENETPWQDSNVKLTHTDLNERQLKSDKRNKTKHESMHVTQRCISRNLLSPSTFGKGNSEKAGQHIRQIEEELVQLKRLAGYEPLEIMKRLEKAKCTNFKETSTQTTNTNVECKKDIGKMKLTIVQMKERMEELESLYKRDGKKVQKLETTLKMTQDNLIEVQNEANKYKVLSKLINRTKLNSIRKNMKQK